MIIRQEMTAVPAGFDKKNYEIIENEDNLPYKIIIHTKQGMEADGHLNENGKLVIPHLMNHWHDALELDYIFNGAWQYIVNGAESIVSKEQFILINCGDIHGINFDFDLEGLDIIGFTLLITEDFIKTLIPDIRESFFDNAKASKSPAVGERLLKIYRMYTESPDEYLPLSLTGECVLLLHDLCASGAKTGKSAIPINSQKSVERLRGILQFVEDNYTEELLQENVAARFYFSRGYFSRFFKSYTGMTFKEYLTRFRLEKARELLLDTDLNMTEIAMRCGFSDSRRFIISYKKYYEMTPYQCRLAQKSRLLTDKD